ncbi:MAG: S8 family serine peptidase [Magnetococcales bacterium]|nr:S8 family serine peptidase [Magnetococcales bacterium]
MKHLNLIGLAVIALVLQGPVAFGAGSKLDAELGAKLNAYQKSQGSPLLRSGEESDAKVPATIHFTGDALTRMQALGVKVNSVLGDVATVVIPMKHLDAVVAMPEVLRLETPSKPVLRLNKSVPVTKADTLRTGSLATNWGGNTGKDVLVGVIDSGIDVTHGDFKDAAGKTRIVRLWNMRKVTGGTPPNGADNQPLYGAECDTAAINAEINNAPSGTSVCNPDDNNNHGSHVAGIAAGSGNGTGNGKAAGRFAGMAPEAGILVANALDGAIAANGDPVLDAIAWMTRVAKSLNKPLVINLSLGSYFGSRDGTSGTQKGIDNASGAGVIVVAAAGNEGNSPIRTELAPMTVGQTVEVTFSTPTSLTTAKLEFWSDGDNQYAVQVVCPNGSKTDFITAGNSLTDSEITGCGKISLALSAPSASNGDRQYRITLDSGTNALASGAWKLNIRADTLGVANEKLGIICGEDESGAKFTGVYKTTETLGILTDTSCARRAIAVAALNTNYIWDTAAGQTDKNNANGPLGDVGNFSSRGPRRVCSGNTKYLDTSTDAGKKNAAECTNKVMKPDLAAPGSYIMSTLSQAAKAKAAADDVEADGVHVAYMGTSMATPHVAGAVALMLQVNPQLTPEDAKKTLFTTLQTNQYTTAANLPTYSNGVEMPTNPNNAWGYGNMDIAAAVNKLSNAGAVNGACGTSNTQSFSTAPATNLCTTGTSTTVTGTGPWNWSCDGANGGTNATCSATLSNATSVLDPDKNKTIDAMDGVLILRQLSGAPDITIGLKIPDNQDNASLKTTIDAAIASKKLDADQNGTVDATDGVMILRSLSGSPDVTIGLKIPDTQTNQKIIDTINALK